MTYLDTVVTHPCADSYCSGAAAENGFAARKAEADKHARYPEEPGVSGRMVPLAVKVFHPGKSLRRLVSNLFPERSLG